MKGPARRGLCISSPKYHGKRVCSGREGWKESSQPEEGHREGKHEKNQSSSRGYIRTMTTAGDPSGAMHQPTGR